MPRCPVDRRDDARVAVALGWQPGSFYGEWIDDADPIPRPGVGWRAQDGTLREWLPHYGASAHEVPTMLRWLQRLADVTIDIGDGDVTVTTQSRTCGCGSEFTAASIPAAVRATLLAYLDNWGPNPHQHDEDEDEDEEDG